MKLLCDFHLENVYKLFSAFDAMMLSSTNLQLSHIIPP